MKHLVVKENDAGYDASVVTAPDPQPGPGEVLVRVAASGLNRADLSQIAGRYPPPPGESPILGMEVSGNRADTGEAVCALLAGGGHADVVAVPVGQLLPVPKGMDLTAAAGLPEAFLTAFVNLVGEGGLGQGQTALIHAGASGVGLAAIQVAKLLGARVAATTRTAAKLPALRDAGADLAIDTSSSRFGEAVAEAWGRDPVHVVLDPVGAATLAGDLRVLAPGGRVIFLSTMSGREAPLDISALMSKRGVIIGSTLRGRSRAEKAELVARFRERMLPAFADGRLRVVVDLVYPPAQAAAAFQRMRDNANVGKILINWR
ncbi:MAG TPA: NAD(P)H-quinone oxidoreductase [Gemmatimonadales bacterium]|nr:NAD(P)H-quinone oxidoreductase [Gemmatimonadales bacterium]